MNSHDHLERALGDQLHRQVDDLHGTPLGLADVKSRAGRIRRNRRIAVGAGVAAALAVVVPTLVTAGGTGPVREPEIPPATRPAPSPTAAPAQTELTLTGLGRGDAPGVEYFTPQGMVLPGQGTVELPYHYNAMVRSPADGGWLAWEGAALDLRYLSEDLEQQGGSATNGSFVSNPERSLVAWTTPEGGAQTLSLHSTVQPGVGQAWDFPESPVVDPVDFLSDGSLVYETRDQDGRVGIGIAEPDGSTTPLRGYVDAISASPVTRMVAVQTRTNPDSSGCFGMVDPDRPATPVWETCDHSLGAFSPDGRNVLASEPYRSGLGVPSVAVLDAATGEPVAEFEQPRGGRVAVQQLVWETSGSFLGIATEGTTVTMLRFGVDGSLEQAVDEVDGDAFGDLPLYMGQDRVRSL